MIVGISFVVYVVGWSFAKFIAQKLFRQLFRRVVGCRLQAAPDICQGITP
jgi:hypothetical protein